MIRTMIYDDYSLLFGILQNISNNYSLRNIFVFLNYEKIEIGESLYSLKFMFFIHKLNPKPDKFI